MRKRLSFKLECYLCYCFLFSCRLISGGDQQNPPLTLTQVLFWLYIIYAPIRSNFITFLASVMTVASKKTQDFIQQYKEQLSADFTQAASPSSSSGSSTTARGAKPPDSSVEESYDPNRVVHIDSGPVCFVCIDARHSFTSLLTAPCCHSPSARKEIIH